MAEPTAQDSHQREVVVAAALAAIAVLAHRYTAGTITEATWLAEVKTLLTNAHLTAAALARGGWTALDADTLGFVGERLAVQFGYLDAFAAQVPVSQWGAREVARLLQYAGGPVRGTYSGVLRRDAGAGAEERNVLGGAHHCHECPALTAQGWVPIGTLPEIGARECHGNCACSIEIRAGIPVGTPR